MSVELGRRLLLSGAAGPAEIQAALFRHLSARTPFVRALVEVGGVSERVLQGELDRSPMPTVDVVVPFEVVVSQLPPDLCRRMLVIPVRRDPRTGFVEVAAVDPYDVHIGQELAFHLKAEVRMVRASLREVERALDQMERGPGAVSRVPVGPSRTAARPASAPPIPLVRRASRDADGARRGEMIEVLGVRDIIEGMEGDGAMSDADGQPILPLTTSKVPRAPSIPRIVEREASSPDTSRGPFSPRSPIPPFPEIEHVLAALERARSRDEIIDHLITGMSTVAQRVGVFAVKKSGIRGMACNADFGETVAFREIEISSSSATVLGIAISKGSYLGPLPATPPHEPLLRFMKGTAGEVAAVLVTVAGRPAIVLFADALGDTLIATRRAEVLGNEASRAFSRILQDGKSEKRGGG